MQPLTLIITGGAVVVLTLTHTRLAIFAIRLLLFGWYIRAPKPFRN